MAITILDGGMGQELIRRTGKITPLWAVQALLDDPQVVSQVHADFFAAGAEVATTDTYNLIPDRLSPFGLEDRLGELTDTACTLAARARDAHGSGRVAGSLGPCGASYRPDLAPPAPEAAEIYARLARLHAPWVDLHLLETMASVDQAKGGIMGASVTGKPVWLAVTVADDDGAFLRSGEPVRDILSLVESHPVDALLVNCATPEAVSKAVEELRAAPCPLGAYANAFVRIAESFRNPGATVDLLAARDDMSPVRYADLAAQWAKSGATLIGGCCEVGPEHIRELSKRFQEVPA